MKNLLSLLLITTPALAAEYAWKCPDGGILPDREKPCAGAQRINVDDMSAAEINAYVRATSADARDAHARAKANEARENESTARQKSAHARLCAGLDGPTLGMTEEQFLKCVRNAEPKNKNTTQTAFGSSVQYVGKPGALYRYVYFTNGRLTAIQD